MSTFIHLRILRIYYVYITYIYINFFYVLQKSYIYFNLYNLIFIRVYIFCTLDRIQFKNSIKSYLKY